MKKLNNETQKIKITDRQGHDGFLVFAMDQSSFNNLMIGQWPQTIDNIRINVKQPRILPSEHSLIIHCVFKKWDITEINNKLKEKYPYFRKATRIIDQNGTPTQMIRADFNTSNSVQQLLKEEYISIGQSIHQIRCNTVHDLEKPCTRPIQCENCLQVHYSGHSSCPQIQQIRQQLKQQQNINRNKIRIYQTFEMKSENFPLLPSAHKSVINSSSKNIGNNQHLNSQANNYHIKQPSTLTKNTSKNINDSVEQILLAHTEQIENVLDNKFNTIFKQITKIDQNCKKKSNDNNIKVINVIQNKLIPAVATLTSILNANISDLTMKNILSTLIHTLNQE
ncbi:unnamed protein product [Rotaria sp. Silwood2]|nr:unnamed protein product [Rotaria sp. Silwood2]CAF3153800.1 unnamed protein product [Rotaria sp. Silwood2]CAF4446827.1 unnamed protein product [Rotaria sp. Silwood2]